MSQPPAAPVPLPHTWRPRRSRAVIAVMGILVLGSLLALLLVVPPGRGAVTVADQISLVVLAGLLGVVLWRLADVRVAADDGGLSVVNLVRRRRLDWAEVVGVRFGRGDAWVMLDLADGTTLAAMGIQRSDGARGERAARELAATIRSLGTPA